jgi:hypothetical protein
MYSIQKEEEEARHVWNNNDSERDRPRQSNQKVKKCFNTNSRHEPIITKRGFITAYEYDIANRIEKLKIYIRYIGSAKVYIGNINNTLGLWANNNQHAVRSEPFMSNNTRQIVCRQIFWSPS